MTPEQVERRRYMGMKQRCYNPNAAQYHNYGGRGITICARWLESFDNFYADMGDCPDGHSLERIDNDGPYSPENCCWATKRQQRLNQRSCNYLEYNGKRMTVTEWAEALGRSPGALFNRIARGYPIEKVLFSGKFSSQHRDQAGYRMPAAQRQEGSP